MPTTRYHCCSTASRLFWRFAPVWICTPYAWPGQGVFGNVPGPGTRVARCWEQPLQAKSIINKQIVGTDSIGDGEHSLGRRGSGHARSGLLLLGCRCLRRFLGNTVSSRPWGGGSPSRTVPGFSWFALLCSSCGHSPDPTQMCAPPSQSYCFPLGLCLMCPFSPVLPGWLGYLFPILKSLSSGLPSPKNPSMTHTLPTHPRENEYHSSVLISGDPLITYYNLPNKYLLSVGLPWARLCRQSGERQPALAEHFSVLAIQPSPSSFRVHTITVLAALQVGQARLREPKLTSYSVTKPKFESWQGGPQAWDLGL